MTNIFLSVFETSLSISPIIAIILFLTPLVNKRYATKWKYFTWIFLALWLLIPVGSVFVRTVGSKLLHMKTQTEIKTDKESEDIIYDADIQPARIVVEIPKQITEPLITQSDKRGVNITMLDIAAYVWLIGSLIFMSVHIISYLCYKRQVMKKGIIIKDIGVLKQIFELRCELHIKSTIHVIEYTDAASPMIIGFLKPVLVLPEEQYSEEELFFVLKHELVHLKRRDVYFKLLFAAANAVHWFNPLVWIMQKDAAVEMELSCDEKVIQGTDYEQRKAYTETLMSMLHKRCTGKTFLSTQFYGGKKIMKKRFRNILRKNGKKSGFFILVCAVILTLGLGTLVGCSVASEDMRNRNEEDVNNNSAEMQNEPDTMQNIDIAPTESDAGNAQGQDDKPEQTTTSTPQSENTASATLINITKIFKPDENRTSEISFQMPDNWGYTSYGPSEPDWGFTVQVQNREDAFINIFGQYGTFNPASVEEPKDFTTASGLTGKLYPDTYTSDDGVSYINYQIVFDMEFYGVSVNMPKSVYDENEEAIQQLFLSISIKDTTDNTVTLTYYTEGFEEQVQAAIVAGNGYSFYLPVEGWQQTGPDMWTWVYNEKIGLGVTHFGNKPINIIKEELISGGYAQAEEDIRHMYKWDKTDDLLYHVKLKESGNDVCGMFYYYPSEAEDGAGRELAVIADTFEASMGMDAINRSYGVSEYLGIKEREEIRGIIDEFATAYFGGNVDAVRKFLADTYEGGIGIYENAGTISDMTVKGLSSGGGKKKLENGVYTVSVALEFKDSNHADMLLYLTLEFVKQEDGWKIQFYGMEG